MTWILRENELRSVPTLPGRARYSYLIKKVADEEQIWSLRNDDGWCVMADDAGTVLIPVWPHSEYATLCATETFANCRPMNIELQTWLDKWIPGMTKDGRRIAAFPVPDGQGVVVDPERFAADLRAELENYDE
jgi:hypothetical protein